MKFIGIFIVFALLLASCSFSATTANFQDLQMASEIDEATSKPITAADVFATDSPIIYLTGSINNAVSDTIIKAEWVYTEEDPAISITSYELELEDIDTDFFFSLSMPDNGWPTGSYEIKLYIDGEYDQSVAFKVE